ncbi:MAG: carboxypeptidase-like regulatory domain-containing protein [Candidatus Aminicenantes bacterium]
MNKTVCQKLISLIIIGAVMLFYTPVVRAAEDGTRAGLKGTVFAADGTTPLTGAVITVKNVAAEDIRTSGKTDEKGSFEITNLNKGIYVMGVTSAEGEFNASNLIGIRAGKTEKVTLAVENYDARTQEAARERLEDQRREGESLVGEVESYNPATQTAMVYLFKGFLQKDDRIHVLYPEEGVSETDFYQKTGPIQFEGREIERAFAGQTVAIKMEENVVSGDLVYVSCKQGIIPLFLSPLGIAAVLAGSGIIYGIVDPLDDPSTVTGFKK